MTHCCRINALKFVQLSDISWSKSNRRDSSIVETPWALTCPPNQGATSIKQVRAPDRIAWDAAAIPPREPPTTTTSHSQTALACGKGDKTGLPLAPNPRKFEDPNWEMADISVFSGARLAGIRTKWEINPVVNPITAVAVNIRLERAESCRTGNNNFLHLFQN